MAGIQTHTTSQCPRVMFIYCIIDFLFCFSRLDYYILDFILLIPFAVSQLNCSDGGYVNYDTLGAVCHDIF